MERKRPGRWTHLFAVLLLGVASLYLTWSLVRISNDVKKLVMLKRRRSSVIRATDSYSFIGSDHPKRLPIEEKLIKMTVQESVHYDIIAPEAESEWLWTATLGDGHVRIGKEQRMFAVAMFHELHCLRAIRGAIEKGWNNTSHARQAHILHCYNYLRQWTLCAADATLEPGDFTKRNFTTERIGATHTCVDWTAAYEMMNEKWIEWDKFRIEHGIPLHDDVT